MSDPIWTGISSKYSDTSLQLPLSLGNILLSASLCFTIEHKNFLFILSLDWAFSTSHKDSISTNNILAITMNLFDAQAHA